MKTFAASLLLLLAACSAPETEQAAAPTPSTRSGEPAHVPAPAGDALEGQRVARRVGCYGCHGDDLAGRKLWGEKGKFQIWSANVTEHREHYSDAGFERLLRTGKTHRGQRPLGMPISMYQYLSEREVRDIVAAIRAAPRTSNPGLKKSWMTAAVRKQQEAYNDDVGDPVAVGAPPVPPGEPRALGRHLVMTSCPECHGVDLQGGGDTPSLVVAKGYSSGQFRTLLRTGITATGKESKSGLMTDVSRNRLAPTLSDADIDAIKAFLDSR